VGLGGLFQEESDIDTRTTKQGIFEKTTLAIWEIGGRLDNLIGKKVFTDTLWYKLGTTRFSLEEHCIDNSLEPLFIYPLTCLTELL
jgi:hypothetical protein